jgi:hypothetical protein
MKINTGLSLQSSRDVMISALSTSKQYWLIVTCWQMHAPFHCCNVPRHIRMLSAFGVQLKISQQCYIPLPELEVAMSHGCGARLWCTCIIPFENRNLKQMYQLK